MTANDSSDVCEANAGALKLVCTVQPLKNSKQLVDIAHVKAFAIVFHKQNKLMTCCATTDFNLWLFALARELHGIGKKILEDQAK